MIQKDSEGCLAGLLALLPFYGGCLLLVLAGYFIWHFFGWV